MTEWAITCEILIADADNLEARLRGVESVTVFVRAATFAQACTRSLTLAAESYRRKHLLKKRATVVAGVRITNTRKVAQ